MLKYLRTESLNHKYTFNNTIGVKSLVNKVSESKNLIFL